MSFGLINIPGSFQGYVNQILVEKLDIFIIIYLNNIFVNIKNQGQGYVKAIW